MSKNLAIVAIPEEQDRVWKLSSEKVPHLTLLFLGDAENNPNLQQIMQFVQHATQLSEHGPFYLDVDRRGELGDDNADVVFFSKRSWNLKWIKQFRAQLLQNHAIRTAYDSTEQYPEWLPHLTMGYPETPAKEVPDEFDGRPLYSVAFDRIAVWTGDYEGPDFRLEWPERELEGDLAVAYSDAQKAALTHYGTKGMRWGQRKTETVTVGGKSKMVTPKKAAKLDAKWEKNQFTLAKGLERHNAMADHINPRLDGLNAKFDKDDFSKEAHDNPVLWSPRYKEYNKASEKLQAESFTAAVTKVHGTNPTGTKKMVVDQTATGMQMVVKNVEAKHAAIEEGDEVFIFSLTRNDRGLITKIKPVEDSMAQTVELGAEFLEHFGTKGMRWGVRNRKGTPVAVAPTATSRVPNGDKRKTKVDAEGGQNHPASPDAIKVAESKAKLKKSGTAALSNKELREVADRLRLEQQVRELAAPKGKKFVTGLLKDEGKQASRSVVREGIKDATGGKKR